MKVRRRIYQSNLPLDEALKKWQAFLNRISPTEEETVAVSDSLGRVTSRAVFAKISSPFFHSSAMDGYAVRFNETFGASETNPLKLKVPEQAVPVNTGEPLPDGFNAVIMVEDVHQEGKFIVIHSPVTPYQHVRTVGEDIVQTELILPENHLIGPVDIGAMLAGGNTEVYVRRKPRITIIPTGAEIISPGEELTKGKIIDSNSYMIGAMVRQWGGEWIRDEIVPDDVDLLKEHLQKAVEHSDAVVIIAGTSAGTKDFTSHVIESMGEIILHGVSIKPGRPIILGSINNKGIIGLPGYPVSAFITFELFAKGLVYRLLGMEPDPRDTITAYLSRSVHSSLGHDEFLRVKIGKVTDRYIATPIRRGAGALMTLQRADAIVHIPAMNEGIAANTAVQAQLLKSIREIEGTIVCIGSHDNALDILANQLKKRYPAFSLSSAHVGSMGGLMAIKRGEAHIAGTHLLDESSGQYNIPFIEKLLKDVDLQLINLVYRQQGLIVKKGNPKGIRSIEDLTRKDVIFINRQAGSGTRLLTDKCLRDKGIRPEDIHGYDREEYTHMGVASAVASGVADAGMGILTAAVALGLDFIPVAKERYDLVVPVKYLEMPQIEALISIITEDREFKSMVQNLGGYDTSDMGKVVFEQRR